VDGSLALGPAERKRSVPMLRKEPDPEVRRRARRVLWLGYGRVWPSIAVVL
jgi:hypothetical protein